VSSLMMSRLVAAIEIQFISRAKINSEKGEKKKYEINKCFNACLLRTFVSKLILTVWLDNSRSVCFSSLKINIFTSQKIFESFCYCLHLVLVVETTLQQKLRFFKF